MKTAAFVAFLTVAMAFISATRLPDNGENWPEYNGNGARSHYSPLTQINTQNVSQLKVAWTYASGGADTVFHRTQMQCNPLIVDGILYGVSANTQVFALDAANGNPIWKSKVAETEGTTSRGVTYWSEGQEKIIFFGAGKWLYAFDALRGKPITTFGQNGRINLIEGLERPGADQYVTANTPNVIYKNLIIVGVRVSESETALLGDIRAYDVRTGKKVWTFRTIPQMDDFGADSWPANSRQNIGGANAWAGMAIDRERGIVYAPTGSAAFDFFGGNRKGDNLFANCLLALDAQTGKRLWHYQLVRHDIWDRDPPAPPNLLTVTHKGPDGRPRKVDAVAQITKQGYIFVFDRVTGKPLFPIEERKFTYDAVPGEFPAASQPIPLKPTYFSRQSFTEKDLNSFVADRDSLVNLIRKARTGSAYIPIGKETTIFFPGTDGGGQWGGAATDPEGILYVPSKEIPVYTSLVTTQKQETGSRFITGAQLYKQNCAACHGEDRRGNHDGSYPPLVDIHKKSKPDVVEKLIPKGRGMMPPMTHLSAAERKAIVDFLFQKESDTQVISSKSGALPYRHTGYNRWYDRNGYPISQPPWGTLTATDLNTGERLWQVPLGEYPELTAKGIPVTGTDNYGGPLVTASGLLIIAATRDEQLRVFDKHTGRQLWQTQLPAAGYASPSTYSIGGRQYIVIACGGGKLKTKSGDKYVAFALP